MPKRSFTYLTGLTHSLENGETSEVQNEDMLYMYTYRNFYIITRYKLDGVPTTNKSSWDGVFINIDMPLRTPIEWTDDQEPVIAYIYGKNNLPLTKGEEIEIDELMPYGAITQAYHVNIFRLEDYSETVTYGIIGSLKSVLRESCDLYKRKGLK
ncbi:MAG TPA: hypothetical protein VF043_34020 [Ktedonobacteraceae bacterium]